MLNNFGWDLHANCSHNDIDNEDGDLDLHSATGFCPLGNCPCHEDPDLIDGIKSDYQNGLLTGDEATRIVDGWPV